MELSQFDLYYLYATPRAPVYHNYCQRLTKREFDEGKVKESLRINSLKDAHIIMTQYDISNDIIDDVKKETGGEESENETMTNPFEKLENRAYDKIRIAPYRTELNQWVYDKSYCCDFKNTMLIKGNPKESSRRYKDIMFYFVNIIDEDDNDIEHEEIEMSRFRIFTHDWDNEGRVKLYPEVVLDRIRKYGTQNILAPYFSAKMERLTDVLFCE